MKLTRQNQSILSRWEYPFLQAIAHRLPDRLMPDHLTLFGFAGATVVLVAGIAARFESNFLLLSNLGLVIHWLGDSLDGTLARVRHIERPRYGFFIDQMTDVMTNLLIALGIAAAGYARLEMALLVLIGYQMLSAYALIRSAATGTFLVAIDGFGPTEMRLAIILLNTLVWLFGAPEVDLIGMAFTWADGVMLAGFGLMLGLFLYGFLTQARRLSNEEPPPFKLGGLD